MGRKQSRSEARKEAFKLIFQTEINRDDVEFLVQEMLVNKPESKQNIEYIRTVLLGVLEKEEELKQDITENMSDKWKIDRISKVSLALLKLAIYEIKYMDTPKIVVINEAIELAKKYSDDNVRKIINAVLDKVSNEN